MVHIPMKLGLHRLGTTVDHQRFLVVAIWHLFGLSRSCWYLPSVSNCQHMPTMFPTIVNWLVNQLTFKRLHELRSSIVARLEKATQWGIVKPLGDSIILYR